uniref:Coiled-coil domain containing 148 n=1 Tax=Stegastes partitus TaxID=144197 RepID=A0A3B4Z8X0_9TELE
MSGRDVQTFITTYRAEDVEKLTLRMKNGLGSSKYKPADYKGLQAIVDAKRLESDLIGQKFLAQINGIILQIFCHHQVLLFTTNVLMCVSVCFWSLDLCLEREREAFRIATVEPIYQLRDDLRFRLGEIQLQQLAAHPSNWQQVKQQMLSKFCLFQKYLNSTSDNLVNTEDIPKEVLDADCPYPDLKDSLIQAFHSLSERYQSRLQNLQEQLQGTDRFCGWPPDEHQHFQFTLSRYNHDTPNHRALCMDMLSRLFPEKSRQELMDHECVWDLQCFTQAQLRLVTQQWQRDQEELLVRALATLQEAKHAHQEELELHRGRQHQQDICLHLREKLRRWRAQQEEVARLEAAIAARQQEEEEARFKKEQEKEAAVRSSIKPSTARRPAASGAIGNVDCGSGRVREEVFFFFFVHTLSAPSRVQFRADVLQQRRMEKEAKELERQREEQERQNRLEVVVVAEADPERMMADTEAWRSRHLNVKEFELPRPLYSINTYTDTQIVSDPRVRVEQALREAGLHHSRYAKEVLSVIKPPKPPRPDTKSILKF